MTIRHHVSDDLLFDYATGALGEAWSLAVAVHLTLCPICRERAARFTAVGGVALDALEPEAMTSDALADCLRRIDEAGGEPEPQPATRVSDQSDKAVFPAPLRDYVGGDVDAVRWSAVGGGVRQCRLETADKAQARLLYIPAGEAVPEHGHRGLELTLVLTGSFRDGAIEFRRGDLEIADEAATHIPTAGEGEPCICLAVTDAPLRFRSLLPRLVQPFVRI